MTPVRFCANCGAEIGQNARFCPSCGARQADFAPRGDEEAEAARPEPPPPEPEPPPPPPEPERPEEPPPGVAERIGGIDAAAGELAGRLGAGLRLPGVLAAALAALIGAGATLGAGLVLAVVFPRESLIGVLGLGANIVTEAFRQAVGTLLADTVAAGFGASGRVTPAILVLVPLVGCALGARSQAARTAGQSPAWRLGWGAATGIPFAVLMLVFAVIGGGEDEIEPSVGGAFGLGLLWGALGGAAGVALALRREGATGGRLPDPLRAGLRVSGAALGPLAAALALLALLGTWVWLVQTARDVGGTRLGRTEGVSLAENGLYFAEHGLHLTELGSLASFEAGSGLDLPIPVEEADELGGPGEDFRIFAYREAMPVYTFLPLVLLAIAIPALLALYAGFAVARARAAPSALLGAAWGAVVGPAWAITLSLLDAIVDAGLFGSPNRGSVFASALLFGAVLGALGGLLAAQPAPARAEPA